MVYVIAGSIIFGLTAVLEILLIWKEVTREAALAWRGIFFWWIWFSVVAMSYTGIANNPEYRRLFGSNEKRWAWLAGLAILFIAAAINMGRGQPLIQGVIGELAKKTEAISSVNEVEYGKSVFSLVFGHIYQTLKIDKLDQEVRSYRKAGEKKATEKKPERPYYGLSTWSHVFVAVMYFLCAVFYGLAARREEVLGWVEERRRTRPRRIEAAREAQAETGVQAPGTTRRRRNWWLFSEGLIDVAAEIIGNMLSARFFGRGI